MPAPDFILTNARISPGPGDGREVEALASRRGRIVALGSRRTVERSADSRTQVLDAEGRRALPGFIDAHVHLVWGYQLGHWIDLTDHPTLLEVQRRVREYAHAHPEEEAILGHGFDYAALGLRELPRREDLDSTVYDRPVLLTSWDGHTGWANSRFVERAERAQRTAGRDLGGTQRDPGTGRPTGIYFDSFDLTGAIPEFRRRRSVEGLERMLTAAVGYGITTAFDAQVPLDALGAYTALRQKNALPLRIRAAIYHPPDTPPQQYPEFMRAVAEAHDDWFDVGAVKLYLDGVQETGTAALLEPYANAPASTGPTVYPVERYEAIVQDLDRRGFQILTHACGDRAVRLALDAYERAATVNRMTGRRHRIEHCETVSERDLPRFAALGVVPCMMPRHSAPELTHRWREAMGPDRTLRSFAWREMLDSGAALSFASDWPVADLNPWVGVQSAVARETPDGAHSPHRLGVAEAVAAYTRGAAYASHCETTRGTLEVGKYADLVVVAPDPFSAPPTALAATRTLLTVVDGRVVFADEPAESGRR